MDDTSGPGAEPDTHRQAELVHRLADVRRRIADGCAAAGRSQNEVTLIGVTKLFPVTDAEILARLGLGDLGESRDQEARAKAAQLAEARLPVRWHFVGRIQTNKARSIARYADAVHAVDRPALVEALDTARGRTDREPLDVFVQASLDGDPDRGGIGDGRDPAPLLALADAVQSAEHLRLAGVMAVAPLDTAGDAAATGAAFDRLDALAAALHAHHPSAAAVSAGMSGDLETALAHGATHVRVGTALLGSRQAH